MRETVIHIHSPEFREEFYPLVRNDEIHTRVFCMHLWLLSDRLKHSNKALSFSKAYLQHKQAVYILCGRRFS